MNFDTAHNLSTKTKLRSQKITITEYVRQYNLEQVI